MQLKKMDFLVFLMPVLIGIVSAVIAFGGFSSGNTKALIVVDGKTVKTVNLENAKDQTIDLLLKYHNIIEIKDGKIRISSANCKDQICVNTGYISKSGQVAVCIPSKLMIKIIGEKQDYDIVVGNFFAAGGY